MKKFMISGALMCMLASAGYAQTSTSSPTDTSTSNPSTTHTMSKSDKAKSGKSDAMGTKNRMLRGCIEASGDEFMLKTRGGRKQIELMSSEDLKPHVGHMVKVTGAWDRSADKKEMAGMGHDEKAEKGEKGEMKHDEMAEHKGKMEHHFKVATMDMISETCKMEKSTKAEMKEMEKAKK